jgi:hypothetical protein
VLNLSIGVAYGLADDAPLDADLCPLKRDGVLPTVPELSMMAATEAPSGTGRNSVVCDNGLKGKERERKGKAEGCNRFPGGAPQLKYREFSANILAGGPPEALSFN